ncbi:MAG: SRPBCC family protein, partial [Flavobacterium sp.]
ITKIKLIKKGVTPNSQIVLLAASIKMPYTLTGNLNAIDADNTEVQLAFEGDFNPMMAMMIKGPITKFIVTLAQNMGKL